MTKEIIETVKHNTAQIARIAFTLEEILRLVKKDQQDTRERFEKRWDKEDEQKTGRGEYPRAHNSLALAPGSGPKLQAASNKLQATGCKLDKKTL